MSNCAQGFCVGDGGGREGSERSIGVRTWMNVAHTLSWRVYDETKSMRDTSGGIFQEFFKCFRRMIVACFACC